MNAILPPLKNKSPKAREHSGENSPPPRHLEGLAQTISNIEKLVPPLWPLGDYVAVNPFLGYADLNLLETQKELSMSRDCRIFMDKGYFRSMLDAGKFTASDIAEALQTIRNEQPHACREIDFQEILCWLANPEISSFPVTERILTISEQVDKSLASDWTNHVVNDISRHCGSHFDLGQAIWKNPWKGESLYIAWREACLLSARMEMLGLTGFRKFVSELPAVAEEAISSLLHRLAIPLAHQKTFLLAQIHSVSGWGSYIRSRTGELQFTGKNNPDFTGLLAIRLAYDAALWLEFSGRAPIQLPDDGWNPGKYFETEYGREQARLYVLQKACEIAYRNRLIPKISGNVGTASHPGRKELQMVFCIDVRSEVMRRSLEAVSPEIETMGFAGFFGLPFAYAPLGSHHGRTQCPVLLKPAFQLRDGSTDTCNNAGMRIRKNAEIRRKRQQSWKNFQVSPSSCFSFVEAMGLGYFMRLIGDSLGISKWFKSIGKKILKDGGLPETMPEISRDGEHGIPEDARAGIAESILRNLGLTGNFAKIVAICGHASEVTNNPYRAGLDCGACGGHSGEPNARVAALILNDPKVRLELAIRGISIPEDTWFVGALHNTTTDEVTFFETERVPSCLHAGLQQAQAWVSQAGAACRAERVKRMGGIKPSGTFQKSRDWSEVRPEWGLAGNAAFVVAPRSRTSGVDLGGRTFLHNYDYQKDPDFKVLELVMTAPMIVTNWINMQYYASTVDNKAFGSGNKTIHNVVGQFGIFQGNGGDLMTGLPWQSVHDGRQYQHEPLRLLVVIDAPRKAISGIIQRHENVARLVDNGWLSLVSLEGETAHQYLAGQQWKKLDHLPSHETGVNHD